MSLTCHARIAVMTLDNKMITGEALREIRERANREATEFYGWNPGMPVPMIKVSYKDLIGMLDEIARLNALLSEACFFISSAHHEFCGYIYNRDEEARSCNCGAYKRMKFLEKLKEKK